MFTDHKFYNLKQTKNFFFLLPKYKNPTTDQSLYLNLGYMKCTALHVSFLGIWLKHKTTIFTKSQ